VKAGIADCSPTYKNQSLKHQDGVVAPFTRVAVETVGRPLINGGKGSTRGQTSTLLRGFLGQADLWREQCDMMTTIQKIHDLGIREMSQRQSSFGNVTIKHTSAVTDTPTRVKEPLEMALPQWSARMQYEQAHQRSQHSLSQSATWQQDL
jgi:hypothetical protein